MKIILKSQQEFLKEIRKPILPSSRKHRTKKDYNRRDFKNWK